MDLTLSEVYLASGISQGLRGSHQYSFEYGFFLAHLHFTLRTDFRRP
jgi:hypothetical protein